MTTPRILIPSAIFEKIMFWVDKADFEVSGFGKCTFNGTDFEIKDAILLKQKGGSAHTDIEPESLSKAQYDLREQPGDLKFWWHSHVNMNTFMSPTDKATLSELGARGWALASVFNKRREVTSAIAYAQTTVTPFKGQSTELFYDDKLQTIIVYPALTEEHKVQLAAQFDENVSRGWVGPVLPSTTKRHVFGFTYYEERAAEALNMTPKAFRKKRRKATTEEKEKLEMEVNDYYLNLRGYGLKDFFATHTKRLAELDDEDDDQPDLVGPVNVMTDEEFKAFENYYGYSGE